MAVASKPKKKTVVFRKVNVLKRVVKKKTIPAPRKKPEPDGRVGQWYWHIHHMELVEKLDEPLNARIDYVKANKAKNEIATRLKWLTRVRPMTPALKALLKKYDESWFDSDDWKVLEAEHKKQHPKCPWKNGTLVFPKK